jgi:hypothetical protein
MTWVALENQKRSYVVLDNKKLSSNGFTCPTKEMVDGNFTTTAKQVRITPHEEKDSQKREKPSLASFTTTI